MDSSVSRGHRSDAVRLLKPVLRAYALGYLSSTAPRALSSLRCLRRKDLSHGEKLRELPFVLFGGKEAGEWGVASQVVDGGHEQLLEKSIATAEKIASYSRIAVTAGKEVVDKSQELPLKEGVEYERRLFHALFGSKDQKIGMEAFTQKAKPEWSHE